MIVLNVTQAVTCNQVGRVRVGPHALMTILGTMQLFLVNSASRIVKLVLVMRRVIASRVMMQMRHLMHPQEHARAMHNTTTMTPVH